MAQTPTFEELFRDCRRTAVHLEMRDAYMKSDPAFIDWKAGVPLNPAERWADWHTTVTRAVSRGVEVRRARVVSTPVSEYIRFEYDVTDGLNIAAGESVRWLSRRSATDLTLPGNDFWVFDSHLVLVNHFDGEGENMDMELTEDPEVAKLCGAAFEAVWERGTPHSQFELA
ncbi:MULTISPECIES: DUF6879 family protein [Streptomyces]|uniref:DUF6879 family protein n=1 Tax=Streptomyces TaxID=1883 RepID=UPI00163C9AAF|nr:MULTISPECIES: DUF6879 family protein [Streptomyces]MBC2876222.1 hypothetical protein [Streptomyces sp. TYQ1024]UBI35553.1 hypothetical protein K7I03_03090 [Streptomyces mobaraensis]UKW28147.1 hypothetical protein MCU78_03120 [Streptomyces sp. TYQ1024]